MIFWKRKRFMATQTKYENAVTATEIKQMRKITFQQAQANLGGQTKHENALAADKTH